MKDKMKLNLFCSTYILTALFWVYIRFSGHFLYNKIYPFFGFFYMFVPLYLLIRAMILVFILEDWKQAFLMRLNFALAFIISLVNFNLLSLVGTGLSKDDAIKIILQKYWNVYGAIYVSVFVAIYESFGRNIIFYFSVVTVIFAGLVLFGKIIGFVFRSGGKYFSKSEREKRLKERLARKRAKTRTANLRAEEELNEVDNQIEKVEENHDEELYIKVKTIDEIIAYDEEEELIPKQKIPEQEVEDSEEKIALEDELEEASERLINNAENSLETEGSNLVEEQLEEQEVAKEETYEEADNEISEEIETEEDIEGEETLLTETINNYSEESVGDNTEVTEETLVGSDGNLEENQEIEIDESVSQTEDEICESELESVAVNEETEELEEELVEQTGEEENASENLEEQNISDSLGESNDFDGIEEDELEEEEMNEKQGFFTRIFKIDNKRMQKIKELKEKRKQKEEEKKQHLKEIKEKYEDEIIEIKPKFHAKEVEGNIDELEMQDKIIIYDDDEFVESSEISEVASEEQMDANAEEEIIIPKKAKPKGSLAEAEERILQILAESNANLAEDEQSTGEDEKTAEIDSEIEASKKEEENSLKFSVNQKTDEIIVEDSKEIKEQLNKGFSHNVETENKNGLTKENLREEIKEEQIEEINIEAKDESERNIEKVKDDKKKPKKKQKNKEESEAHTRYEQVPLSFEKEAVAIAGVTVATELIEKTPSLSEESQLKFKILQDEKVNKSEELKKDTIEEKLKEVNVKEVVEKVEKISVDDEFKELKNINNMKKTVEKKKAALKKLSISEKEFLEAKEIFEKFPDKDYTFYQRKLKRGLLKTQEIITYLKEGM